MARRRFDREDVSRVVILLFALVLVAAVLHDAGWWQVLLCIPIAIGALVLSSRRRHRRERTGDPW